MLETAQITPYEKEAVMLYLKESERFEALLTEGHRKEEKFVEEGKSFIISAEEMEKYLEAILQLYSLALKEQASMEKDIEKTVYTIVDIVGKKDDEISKILLASFEEPQEKIEEGQVLLEIVVNKECPFIPIENVLGETYQGKILIVPFVQVTQNAKRLKGCKNCYQVKLKPMPLKSMATEELKRYKKNIMQRVKVVQEIMQKIGKEPLTREQSIIYANWKRMLHLYLKGNIKKIKEIV